MCKEIFLAKGHPKAPSELTGITATTTSNNIRAFGHNALILYVTFTVVAGTWTVKLQGKSPTGSYVDLYKEDGNQMYINGATASKAQMFTGIPEDFKIVATEDVNGGTVTVGYELLTI